MTYLGDFAEDSTVYLQFTTHDGSGGAVAPSTAFEAADLAIYKDNGATQKATTNGVTMTSPFDSVTGLHAVTIDTSVDTGDAGFWATGSDYIVVLNPDETVDSQTVVRVIGQFSIENRTTFPKADYPTNFADLSITATTGRVDLASIEGSDATDQIRDAIVDDATRIDASELNTAIDNLVKATAGIVSGSAQTGTLSTTQMTTDLTEATDDHYIGRIVTWTSGVLAGQSSDITDYNGTSKMLTYTAVTEAPSNGDTFVIT